MTAALYAERVHVRHPKMDFDSLRDISVDVIPGEILALLGPNGSGKSTLLRTLGRELRPRQGRVLFDGLPLSLVPRRKLARRLARLPQEPVSPEGLTIEALVAFGRHPHRSHFSPLSGRDQTIISEALQSVELGDMRHRAVDSLSGGERRRAWIAMALAQEPDYLLLDEPTSALDLRHQFELLELLGRLNRDRGTTIILSIHDLEQAARIAHRVAVMARGRLYEIGPPEETLNEETLLDVFRVRSRVQIQEGKLSIRVLGPGDPIRTL